MSSGYFYLGSPYSNYHAGIDVAFEEVCRQAGSLIAAGVKVYYPVAHFHPIAAVSKLDPLNHDIWLPADEPMMIAARGLIVLKMIGYSKSRGLQYEQERFREMEKDIYYMTPGIVPPELLWDK